MNITQETIDKQSALLKVKIEPVDYHRQYDNALKSYQRKLQLPGFRAGKVPLGIVKNRYGKSLLAEELNKVLNNSIQSYIEENQLKVLGSPIPSEGHEETGDWENPADFEFVYELGLAPVLDIAISSKDVLHFHTIKVDEKMLEDHILDATERYGEVIDEEVSAVDRIVLGAFVELDETGEVKPGGIFAAANFKIADQDEKVLARLTGLKAEDVVELDPKAAILNHKKLAEMLAISEHQVSHLHPHFRFTVKEIKWLKPAELNKVLFDKVYGSGKIEDEKAFRARMKEDISKNFLRESDQLLKRDITRFLVDKFNPVLPDGFLKRWILMTNEKPISAAQIEHDYEEYKRGLQWQLIFNELVGSKAITVTQEMVVEKAQNMLAAQYAQYGIPAPDEEELRSSAMRILAKEDQSRGIYDALYDEKLLAYIKHNATVKEKEVSFDEFVTLANN